MAAGVSAICRLFIASPRGEGSRFWNPDTGNLVGGSGIGDPVARETIGGASHKRKDPADEVLEKQHLADRIHDIDVMYRPASPSRSPAAGRPVPDAGIGDPDTALPPLDQGMAFPYALT